MKFTNNLANPELLWIDLDNNQQEEIIGGTIVATPAGRETFGEVTLNPYTSNESELFDSITNVGFSSWPERRKDASQALYDQAGSLLSRWDIY